MFVACFREYRQYLNAGEQAVVLVLARDRDQAKIVFRYIKGIIAAIPPLYAMVVNETADGVELDNGVTLMVKTSDFRAIRGLTIALCVADEVAFWDGQGVNPDKEIFTALRPAMATIRGSKLLCISYRLRQGRGLFEAYREYYGQQSEHALVWQADTRTMNPTLDQKLIERELEKDPESARAEWLGVFREDLEAAFTLEAIEACVIRGRDELPPSRALSYRAFCDPSGGRRDAYTLAIGHRERDKAVIDLLRAWSAPFDPELVTAEAAELSKNTAWFQFMAMPTQANGRLRHLESMASTTRKRPRTEARFIWTSSRRSMRGLSSYRRIARWWISSAALSAGVEDWAKIKSTIRQTATTTAPTLPPVFPGFFERREATTA